LIETTLKGVRLSGTKYNAATKWPPDFDPVRFGAVYDDEPAEE
jgi:hypothetical protein